MAPTSLFAALGGSPDAGGSWTDPNGLAHGPNVDPAVDPSGVYTYTIACDPAHAFADFHRNGDDQRIA
ncbi:MAG: hypothetical protein IPI55_00240 [Flavobacteriales bacterium]|nr:hypothetical protein [Flavobacteriales bacterium]